MPERPGSGSFVAGSGPLRTIILDIPSHSHPWALRAQGTWILSNTYPGTPKGGSG